ncbi:MAG TPA: MEDS domain-containing protein [Trebonia sp.]|nr:MEDS domain-containing protein [Trebonia sp.]
MPAGDLHGRTVGVDRLQPGDHAFLGYDDDATRWEILSVFAQQGLARGEKVMLLVDTAHDPARVAARVAGGPAGARHATATGQLVVSNAPRFARGEFNAGRLVEGARRRVATVLAEGFSGLRSASEMSLTLAPVDHLGQAVDYEIALHTSLFSGQPAIRYTALCYWDERLFGGTEAMEDARAVHPVTVLPRLGTLHTVAAGGSVSVAGDSDVINRETFDQALASLARQPGITLVLDIADLSFFDAYSASAVLRLAAGLTPPRRLEVRCRSAQRQLLHLLGGRSVRQLSIVTTRL